MSHYGQHTDPRLLAMSLSPAFTGCVLTTLQLLEAVDPVGSHEEILNLFDKLVVIDPYRKGYYNDLSKYWPLPL